jgi:WD40 repeat protein
MKKQYLLVGILFALVVNLPAKPMCSGISYALPSGSSAPVSVAFSPNGSHLATANSNANNVILYAVNSNRVLGNGIAYSPPLGSKVPASVAFSPNGSYLATANEDSNDVTIFVTSCLTATAAASTVANPTTSATTASLTSTSASTLANPTISSGTTSPASSTGTSASKAITSLGSPTSVSAAPTIQGKYSLPLTLCCFGLHALWQYNH